MHNAMRVATYSTSWSAGAVSINHYDTLKWVAILCI